VHKLLLSLHSEPDWTTEAAWEKEIRERIQRHDAGEGHDSTPASEVFEEIGRRLNQQ